MTKHRYYQNQDIVFRQEADEGFLFNLNTGEINVINETGCFIWKLCDGVCTKADIIARMLDEFDAEERTVKEDVDRYLPQLITENFVIVK